MQIEFQNVIHHPKPTMSLTLNEQIVNLDGQGLLMVSLNPLASTSVSAYQLGYADWYSTYTANVQDRLPLFSRQLDTAAVRTYLARKRTRFQRIAAAINAVQSWFARDPAITQFLQMPFDVMGLSGGRALMLFVECAAPKLIRIVDVVNNKVLNEILIDELSDSFQIESVPGFAFGHDFAMVHAKGADRIALSLRDVKVLLQVTTDHRIELITKDFDQYEFDLRISKDYCVTNDHEPLWLSIMETSPTGLQPALKYTPALKRKNGFVSSTAPGLNRIAVSHPRGIIEIVDVHKDPHTGTTVTTRKHVLRPLNRATSDNASAVEFSSNGRLLLLRSHDSKDYDYETLVVLDLEQMQYTTYVIANHGSSMGSRWGWPKPRYRRSTSITNIGVAHLDHRRLSIESLDQAQWKPLVEYDVNPRLANQEQQQLFDSLIRTAVTLVPQKNPAARSHLYGLPRITKPADIPMYKGHPLFLLCELELNEAVGVIGTTEQPQSGYLQIFTAVDKDLELIEDEPFVPALIHIQRMPAEAVTTTDETLPHCPAVPVSMSAGKQWPLRDDVAVESFVPEPLLDAYCDYLETVQPDGLPEGHRLGGYPYPVQYSDHPYRATNIHGNEQSAGSVHTSNEQQTPEECRWHLLVQLDTDDTFMWGCDSGMLYIMIREDHLAAGDFSKVVAMTDGY